MSEGKKILKLRSWFRINGKMDFELNPNLPKEKQGKNITYSCEEIDKIFEEVIQDEKVEDASCECGFNYRMALDCTSKPCKHIMFKINKML